MRLINVVFPAPLGPMSPRISPWESSKLTFDTASTPAKRLVRLRTQRIDSMLLQSMRPHILGEVAPTEVSENAAEIGEAPRHEDNRDHDNDAEGKRSERRDLGRQPFGDAGKKECTDDGAEDRSRAAEHRHDDHLHIEPDIERARGIEK